MAPPDPILASAPVAGIAEPHQSTVEYILRSARQGLFTAAEAELMVDQIRALATGLPSLIDDSDHSGGSGSLPIRPDRTVS